MKFESIKIKNFRNFEDIELTLSNKNIFFGLNDVGKTNFLYALRYVFDKDIRKLNLVDSDFHNKQFDKPIEIIVTLDISDVEDSDCQKLRAQLKALPMCMGPVGLAETNSTMIFSFFPLWLRP